MSTGLTLIHIAQCTFPDIIQGGTMEIAGTSLGSKVKYACQRRFSQIVGSSTRACQSDGTWSGYKPKCVGKFIIITT